jgi:hypothetical protein
MPVFLPCKIVSGRSGEEFTAPCTHQLLACMIHDLHHVILVPPTRILNAFDLSTHHNDLTSRDELSATVGRAEMLRNAGRRNSSAERLGHAVDELRPLPGRPCVGWVRSQHKVAVQIDNKCIWWCSEQSAAFSGHTEDVRARLLYQILGVTGMNNRNVKATPLVNADHVADGFSGHGEHGRVVRNENNAASRRDSCLEYADNVRNAQTAKEWPHGEVLEASWRGGELVAQSIILHVDAHQVVQSRCREAENSGDLLGMEQVSSLVPVDPHPAQVVAKKVVKRVARQEAQAVRNPVSLAGSVEVVRLSALAKVANGFRALVISTRPNAKSDTVQRVRRVLLEDKCMVNTVRLASSSADLNIMREACL